MRDVPTILAGLPPVADIPFEEFGEIEIVPLSKIQQLTGGYLGRNWVTIPHVTHHDLVDVTEAENGRVAWNHANPDRRVTPAALQVAALARVLHELPMFNGSVASDGEAFIRKTYVNVGVAVDTPKGLLVAVVRDADGKSLSDIAGELAALATKARTRGLSTAEMAGGSITLSSLGHIGGTAFTPIINGAEVAILGTTAIRPAPVPASDGSVAWRKTLPLSLSYDHRVINGADAARFTRAIGAALADPAIFG